MTNAKVTLPPEVIEAIEELRTLEFTDAEIVMCAVNHTQPHTATTYTLYEWASANKTADTLMAALVNGYEVVKSPKEKALEKYRAHESDVIFYKGKTGLDRCEVEQERYSSGYVSGVKDIIEIYGIKIGGINA